MACATLRKESLCSVRLLEAYPLSPLCRDLFFLATQRLKGVGNGRLTTSFLLLAMIDMGALDRQAGPLRLLYEATEKTNPEAFRRVKAGYIGWYRRSCLRNSRSGRENVEADSMTPYVPRVLNVALSRARGDSEHAIGANHLLGALLTYDPGYGAVQPGIQYILSLIRAGLKPVSFVQPLSVRRLSVASGLSHSRAV